MFPVRFCGFWSLIACTDPSYIGSELVIDYNTIKFTPIKRYGFIKVKKIYMDLYFYENKIKLKLLGYPL